MDVQSEQRLHELQEFVSSVDRDLQRVFPFVVEEVRDSGSGKGAYTVRGHASVFNTWSLDLGGFREKIAPGAFDAVLASDPHVLHLWDHDSRFVLSSTRNKTLELSVDEVGLRYWSKVAPTSYAADLRVLLDRHDIDQSSFAFIPGKQEWVYVEEDGVEVAERTVLTVDRLFDVTTCAMGAYPTTDAVVAVRAAVAKNGKRTFGSGVARVILQAEVAEKLAEKRADTESVSVLSQMYELGQEFMDDEVDPEDSGDRDAMAQILEQLETLIQAEAAEDPAGADDTAGRGRPTGGQEQNTAASDERVGGESTSQAENGSGEDTERSTTDRPMELAELKAHVAERRAATRKRVFPSKEVE